MTDEPLTPAGIAPPPAAPAASSPAGAAPPVEIDASSAAGREILSHADVEEELDGEVVQSDREWLAENAGAFINFLELVNPRSLEYPDIKEIRADIDKMTDAEAAEFARALRMYEAASAAIPPWLMKNLAKIARAVMSAQGLELPE